LKWQRGKCEICGLPFSTEDVLEVHHINGNHSDNRYMNLSLLHGHCHDIAHSLGADDNSHSAEKPDDGKAVKSGLGEAVGWATAPLTLT